MGRTFRKLRVSLTDACNFACIYCVPHGKRLHPVPGLDAEQIVQCVRLLNRVSPLRSVRITGGEPLIAPQLEAFLERVSQLDIPDLSLTTNGHLLRDKLPLLLAAGIRRINVSVDSLDPVSFQEMTRGGDLAVVLDGIDAALAAGVQVKLNAVPIRGVNHEQVWPLIEYGLHNGIEVRFIELMRMGHLRDAAEFDRMVYTLDDILADVSSRHEFSEIAVPPDSTARRWRLAGSEAGTFGIIPNVSAPFCAGCDRLRLTAQGRLYGCISSARWHDMSGLLELSEELAAARLVQLLGAALQDKQPVRFEGMIASMRALGG